MWVPVVWLFARLYFIPRTLHATILATSMSSPLSPAILDLASTDSTQRATAALEIYRAGRALADNATTRWWADSELSALLGGRAPSVTVGLAVSRETFVKIRVANGSPRLAEVPPDQDAEEFELHFADGVSIDVLTSRAPGGTGAIAKYLAKFGEGVQQVEYRCMDVERATQILKEKFEVKSVYPETRPGADGTRVNFFLVPSGNGKVLIELYEPTSGKH
jgi:hypothetical protein